MKQHYWFGNEDDYRLLPTSDACLESIVLGKNDGIRYFAASVKLNCVELLLVDRGKVTICHRGRRMELLEGQGTLFLPGEVRGYSMNQDGESKFVSVCIRGVQGKPVQKFAGPTIFSLENVMVTVRLSCDLMMEATKMTGPCAREVGKNALNTLICMINIGKNLEFPSKKPLSQAVLSAVDYIDANYACGPSIEEIAASCFLSPSRLGSLMKKETGFSPFDYVIERRIGDAQQRLMYGDQSISDIARDVGYPNLSSFSAAFSKRIGISPESFRRSCGAFGEIVSKN